MRPIPCFHPALAPVLLLAACCSSCLVDLDGATVRKAELHPRDRVVDCPPLEPDRLHARTRGLGWGKGRSWDPWVVRYDGGYRLFFLVSARERPEGEEWWARSELATAVSQGSKIGQWRSVRRAFISGVDYRKQRVLAGNAEWYDGQFYILLSTGVIGSRREDGIILGVSREGWRFTQHPRWRPIEPSPQWHHTGDGALHYLAWRDPFMFRDPSTDTVQLVWSAGTPSRPDSSEWETCWADGESHSCHRTQYLACIASAALKLPLGDGWSLEPPILSPVVQSNHRRPIDPRLGLGRGSVAVTGIQSGFWEMERPQVILRLGQYHLFFNCYSWHVNPDWLRLHLDSRKPDSSALYHFVSDSLHGDWHPADPPIVVGSEGTGLYGLHFVERSDDMHYVLGWYRGEISLEVSTKYALVWKETGPEIVDTTKQLID